MGFSPPQGRHVAPINVKFGMRERTRSTPHTKFYVYRRRNVGIQPGKNVKISNFQS